MIFENKSESESEACEREIDDMLFKDIKNIKDIKSFPFSYSYYNPQFIEGMKNGNSSNNGEIRDNSKNLDEKNKEDSMSLKDRIEKQIKAKYNLIVPAILIEIHDKGKESIKFEKDDLKNVLF